MNADTQTLMFLWSIAFFGSLIVLVVWVALPFGIFGTKPLLRTLIAEQRKTNELLKAIEKARLPSPNV